MRIVKNGGFSICSFNDELRVEKGQSQLTTLLVTLIFKAKINVEIDVFWIFNDLLGNVEAKIQIYLKRNLRGLFETLFHE